MSFRDYKKYLLERDYRATTVEGYMKRIAKYQKWLEEEGIKDNQVRHQEIIGYIQTLKNENLSQRYLQQIVAILKQYYAFLIKKEVIETNPTIGIQIQGIQRKKLYDLLDVKEMEQIYYQYPSKSDRDIRNKVILGLLLFQGIQTKELAKLELRDINLEQGNICIPATLRSNGRVLDLKPQQFMNLNNYIAKSRKRLLGKKEDLNNHQLIVAEGGREYRMSNLLNYVLLKAQKIHPKVKNAYQIRASVITHWIKSYNLREVQYMAGHRYISSAESYQINNLDSLIEEIEKYHPL